MQPRCSNIKTENPVIQKTKSDAVKYHADGTVSAGDDIGSVVSVFTHTQPLNKMDSKGEKQLDDSMTIYVTTSAGRIYKVHHVGTWWLNW